MQNQEQWRVRILTPGEPEETEIFRSFADAYAVAMSVPDLEEEQGIEWAYGRRADALNLLLQGTNQVKVVWDRNSPQEHCVFVERL
jgi:hypothetical protein